MKRLTDYSLHDIDTSTSNNKSNVETDNSAIINKCSIDEIRQQIIHTAADISERKTTEEVRMNHIFT